MSLQSKSGFLFLAYHIRSSLLLIESTLKETFSDLNISLEQFYVLRGDWKPAGISLAEISAHATLSKEQSLNVIKDLISKAYITEESEKGLYFLSSEGAALKARIMKIYQEQITKASEGLSKEDVEATLSTLLTVQNNLQLSE